MSNPHYSDSGGPGSYTRARSKQLRDEFAAIEAGFDSVEVLKANVANPAFTGVPTAPTAPVATSGQQLATVDFVRNYLGASISTLPPAEAGKVLASADGLSWTARALVPLPSAGEAFKTARQNAAGSAYEMVPFTPMLNGGIQVFTASGNASANATFLDVTGAVAPTTITLPDATTLPVGFSFVMSHSEDDGAARLVSNSGALVAASSDTGGFIAVLTNNSTAGGVWRRATSDLVLDSVGHLVFAQSAETTIAVAAGKTMRAACRVNDTDILVAAMKPSTEEVTVYLIRENQLVLSVVTSASDTTASGTTEFFELMAVTGGFALVYAHDDIIKSYSITVSGDTVSMATAPTTVTATASISAARGIACASNGAKVLIAYMSSTTQSSIVACSYSGTTVTAGTPVNLALLSAVADGAKFEVRSFPAADKFLVSYAMYDSGLPDFENFVRVVTLSALTPSLGASVSVPNTAAAGITAIHVISDSYVVAAGMNIAVSSAPTVRLFSVSGSTLTGVGADIALTAPNSALGDSTLVDREIGVFSLGASDERILVWYSDGLGLYFGALDFSGSAISIADYGYQLQRASSSGLNRTVAVKIDARAVAFAIYPESGLTIVTDKMRQYKVETGLQHSNYSLAQLAVLGRHVVKVGTGKFLAVESAYNTDLKARMIQIGGLS